MAHERHILEIEDRFVDIYVSNLSTRLADREIRHISGRGSIKQRNLIVRIVAFLRVVVHCYIGGKYCDVKAARSLRRNITT